VKEPSATRSRARTLGLASIVVGAGLVVAGLVAAGALRPSDASPPGTPSIETLAPSTAAGSPSGSPVPVAATPRATGIPSPSPTPQPSRTALATRVTVPDLGIDLPVVAANSGYPLCDVAMYQPALGQPGQGRATYLYAHARAGMFLPIYERAIVQGTGRSMLGLHAFVYTSDDLRFEYVVSEVRIHQLELNDAINATTEQLWLQTSEGGPGTPGKTQVVAYPVGFGPVDPSQAHPVPHPVVCG
jgi:hypothetical protein